MPVTNRLSLAAKGDQRIEVQGLETRAIEMDMAYKLTERWKVSTGVRNDLRSDRSPVVPLTQEQGRARTRWRRFMFEPGASWRAYGFVQDTVATSGGRKSNDRVGAGGSYRLTKRFRIDAEASDGELGPAERSAPAFSTDLTKLYLNYSLENERMTVVRRPAQGNLISGVKRRLSDSSSVYPEERYQNGGSNGLTRTTGVNLVPKEHWKLGGSTESATCATR